MTTQHNSNSQHDALDDLLRAWHDENAQQARASRDHLLAQVAGSRKHSQLRTSSSSSPRHIGRITYLRAAAALALVAFVGMMLLPRGSGLMSEAVADVVQISSGGQLEARDDQGQLIGPCPLQHTDVKVDVAGIFTRVTVRQQYANPYDRKVEAVYTFPLSHRAAVDRMRMIINDDRIIEGEVKERQEARNIYESARAAGHVTALLEQERPNIFTQSVANIEPGARIDIEISYIETLESKDGLFTFAFPMTVAPRYMPGYASSHDPRAALLPDGLEFRAGVVERSPIASIDVQKFDPNPKATLEAHQAGEPAAHLEDQIDLHVVQTDQAITRSSNPRVAEHERIVHRILAHAIPIQSPQSGWRMREGNQSNFWSRPNIDFLVHSIDETSEIGQIAGDGLGHIAGRWFWFDVTLFDGEVAAHVSTSREGAGNPGAPFAPATDQVPDAHRISPMPVKPPLRAGHDIAITVNIDTGGPAITLLESELHEVTRSDAVDGNRNSTVVALSNQKEIPNRDFALNWRLDDATIHEAAFVHVDAEKGGFFTLVLAPPARVDDHMVQPRELIFVLDTSGSMSGEPIEKAKAVLTRAIDSMRPGDTFNVITFAGATDILWEQPRANTNENRSTALAWVNSRKGSGGTEMMTAINAALDPGPARADGVQRAMSLQDLANLPADGRGVQVLVEAGDMGELMIDPGITPGRVNLIFDRANQRQLFAEAGAFSDFSQLRDGRDQTWIFTGQWLTRAGERIFVINQATREGDARQPASPIRIVMFLTDGEVGNDDAIIAAVKTNARTTRVFSFGIGNSVNRYLLEGMARAGRGEVEFVTQQSDREAAVDRFLGRIYAPVLTDITLEFSDGLTVHDVLPMNEAGLLPDLFDLKPLIVHGRFDARKTVINNGSVTLRGNTPQGPFERTVQLSMPAAAEGHDVVKSLWGRAKIDDVMNQHLAAVQNSTIPEAARAEIVTLGTSFNLMSRYTSFVAVEKARVTVDGRPMLVHVPIELPSDARWEGYFGDDGRLNQDAVENYSFTYQFENRRPAIAPRFQQGPAQSTTGVVYPQDWPALELKFGTAIGTDAGLGLSQDSFNLANLHLLWGIVPIRIDSPTEFHAAARRAIASLAAREGLDAASRLHALFDIHQLFAVERIVLSAVDLALAGLTEDAVTIIDWLIEVQPDAMLARSLHDAMTDPTLERVALHEQVRAIAEEARTSVRMQIEACFMHKRIEAVLSKSLQQRMTGSEAANAQERQPVTLLVDAVSDELRARLTHAGLNVRGQSDDPPLYVGDVSLNEVAALALIRGVQRIEESGLEED
ncbi:MAG: VIT domain-containing protein [Phycisphaerales bacterium]